ncbi:ABC transporter permease [Asticcacaulis solisilvae]|uniref:ABC transporter permease n=1 Tax=Asticcacaulis solisilvae TaxID=1217274 RepID=UPI003FD7824B
MIRSAILSFYRSLLRHPLYAVLNLSGLAFGIAVFILLSLFVGFETRYDTWLPGSDQIYAITYNTNVRMAAHQPPRYTSSGYALDAVHAVFPDMTGTRVDADFMDIRSGDTVISEDGQAVDRDVFKVFDLPVVAGNREAALAAPDGLILSERMARKYFGRSDAVGQVLYIRDDAAPVLPATTAPMPEKPWRVMAVVRDAPPNAILRFDIVRLRPDAPRGRFWYGWGSQFQVRTYFRLNARDHARLAAGLVPAIKAYTPHDEKAEIYFARFFANSRIGLSPYSSEHLADPRARRAVAAVDLAGFMAFVVSLINYVNLATARAGIRAREVAVRKAAGATRAALVVQFLSEALLLGAAALALAFSLVELSLPILNAVGHLSLKLDYIRDGQTLLTLAAAVLAGSALAGLYPALVLSGFHPAEALATAKTPAGGRHGRILREVLAVIQFAAASAFFIIIAGFAVQVRHLETAELGFTRDGLLVSDALITRMLSPQKALDIQAAWRRTPGIVAVASGPVPGQYFMAPRWTFHQPGTPRETDMQMIWTEGDFFTAYQTRRLAGRHLSGPDDMGRLGVDPAVADVPNAGVAANAEINQSAVRALGFASPDAAIGQTVTLGRSVFRIVGAVADQRFQSPTQKQMPALYVYSANCALESEAIIAYADIDEATARRRIEAVWRALARDVPFDLYSGHEELDYYYAEDRRNTRLFAVGGGIAGLIGAVGLFGMAAFNTSARVQEIAVRKSFGASRFRIARLLVLQLLRPVLIANVVAWPVAYVVLDAWLKPFEDRVAMSLLFFIIGSGLSLLIAGATVAGVALSAARTAPRNALRQV